MAVQNNIFPSIYQRSIFNEGNLRAKPFWTREETGYEKYFKSLEENWPVIKNEGLKLLATKGGKLFTAEDENLTEKEFILYTRGVRMDKNCLKTPQTCKIIDRIEAARACTRCQAKFSLMEAGTHAWPHCAPTNTRLRSHLGLVVANVARIRVLNETREWHEGKLLIFDDSFEHEASNNASTTYLLILIVDLWHPDLSSNQRDKLLPI
jgi:aspartate beta-hydroxylase